MAWQEAPHAKNYWTHKSWMQHTSSWFAWAFDNETNFKDHRNQYNFTVDWIQTNVINWENNAMWRKVNDCFYIRLKNEQDALLFTLKFGKQNNESV